MAKIVHKKVPLLREKPLINPKPTRKVIEKTTLDTFSTPKGGQKVFNKAKVGNCRFVTPDNKNSKFTRDSLETGGKQDWANLSRLIRSKLFDTIRKCKKLLDLH